VTAGEHAGNSEQKGHKMAEQNIDTDKKPSPDKKKPASPDTLAKGGKAGKAELSEDELKDVSGGEILISSKG
jgi:hypothetical protein